MLNLKALRLVIKKAERVENNTNICKEIRKSFPESSQLDLGIKMISATIVGDNYVPLHISARCFVKALELSIAEDQDDIAQIEKEIREDI